MSRQGAAVAVNVGQGQVGAAAKNTAAAQIQFISFAIGDDQYGVDIMSVREIKGWSGVSHLPRQPEYVRGITALLAMLDRLSVRLDRLIKLEDAFIDQLMEIKQLAWVARDSGGDADEPSRNTRPAA